MFEKEVRQSSIQHHISHINNVPLARPGHQPPFLLYYIADTSVRKERRRERAHTSLIRAMVSSIAVGIVEQERAEERWYTEDRVSWMSVSEALAPTLLVFSLPAYFTLPLPPFSSKFLSPTVLLHQGATHSATFTGRGCKGMQ